jgi:uncharacterized protein (DUF4415 family)
MDVVWQAEDSLREKKLESDLKDLLKTMVAFANSVAPGDIAKLFIGEKDDGLVQGVTNIDNIQKTVAIPKGKTRITIRLDDEILAWFRDQVERAGGGNYQTVINEVLRQHVQQAREPLEKIIRRVIREELSRAS